MPASPKGKVPPPDAAPVLRKGARRREDIPTEILRQMNRGEIEARTLAEWLAMDFGELWQHTAPEFPGHADKLRAGGVKERMNTGGRLLLESFGEAAIGRFGNHRADTVRQWAALAVGMVPNLSFARRLELIRPFADDPHPGVREMAWMSVRPHLAAELEPGLARLAEWSRERSENLRRFASEISRPKGVWCSPIRRLREHPELGEPILEPLRSDPSRYVQNSVGNWLNDAGKSNREWVERLCRRWSRESPTRETAYITKRAQRTCEAERAKQRRREGAKEEERTARAVL